MASIIEKAIALFRRPFSKSDLAEIRKSQEIPDEFIPVPTAQEGLIWIKEPEGVSIPISPTDRPKGTWTVTPPNPVLFPPVDPPLVPPKDPSDEIVAATQPVVNITPFTYPLNTFRATSINDCLVFQIDPRTLPSKEFKDDIGVGPSEVINAIDQLIESGTLEGSSFNSIRVIGVQNNSLNLDIKVTVVTNSPFSSRNSSVYMLKRNSKITILIDYDETAADDFLFPQFFDASTGSYVINDNISMVFEAIDQPHVVYVKNADYDDYRIIIDRRTDNS